MLNAIKSMQNSWKYCKYGDRNDLQIDDAMNWKNCRYIDNLNNHDQFELLQNRRTIDLLYKFDTK